MKELLTKINWKKAGTLLIAGCAALAAFTGEVEKQEKDQLIIDLKDRVTKLENK